MSQAATAINSIESVPVELTVVLGNASMPIHHLLRMGRGAVIELDADAGEEVRILANNTLIALGEVVVQRDRISVAVTRKLKRGSAGGF